MDDEKVELEKTIANTDNKSELSTKSRKNKKTGLFIIIIFVSLFSISLGIFLLNGRYLNKLNEKPVASGPICDESMVLEYDSYYKDNNYKLLEPLIDKIKSKDGHQQDKNCVYMNIGYHLMINDAESSEKYLDILKKLSDKQSASYFEKSDYNLDLIQSRIDAIRLVYDDLDRREEEFINNMSDFVRYIDTDEESLYEN